MTSLTMKTNMTAMMGERQLSNVTLRTESSEILSIGRRSEPCWRRRSRTRPSSDVSSPVCHGDPATTPWSQTEESRTESPLSSGDKRPRKCSDSAFRGAKTLRKYYVDQQTGEMKLRATGNSANHTLASNAVNSLPTTGGRHLLEKRWRSRLASDASSAVNSRPCWDHSLRTKSIVMNSRAAAGAAASTPYLKYPIVPPAVLPRLTRSAEATSGFEIPTRYPRGQQRPTGLASGHQALQQRHRQILEASMNAQRQVTWPLLRHNNKQAIDVFKNPYYDVQSQYLSRTNQALPRSSASVRNLFQRHDVTMQQRCSQQASLMRSNQKCRDWLNTWVED